MKKNLLLVVCVALGGGLFAENPPMEARPVSYGTHPVAVRTMLAGADLRWVNDMASLVQPGGFTFLSRRDSDHWMALSNKGGWWLLQIHDETTGYNFRGQVAPATGRLTVEKGMDWPGQSTAVDAQKAAEMALAYVQRARAAEMVFGEAESGSHTMPAAHDSAPSHETSPAHEAPASHETPHAAVEASGHSNNSELWQRLVDGNLRFVSGHVEHPNQSQMRIEEVAQGQHPFAIVVSCSDSRVPPEILFDQGLGDLFVIRTAGEVVTPVELGSIEYAVEHLKTPYLVVLGHKKCGAVDATLKGGDLPPNIEAIAEQIRPAVEASRFFKGDPLDNAVRQNAKTVLAKIQTSSIVAEALHSGALQLRAAYYDLDTGKVTALP